MSSRPMLKLTFSKPKVEQAAKPPSPPPPATPGSSLPKLKFKIGPKPGAEDQPPPASASKSTKKPKSKDTPRAPSSKKRARDVTGHDARTHASATTKNASGQPTTVKRLKFTHKPPPAIRLKSRGQPPHRPKGSGYDSEASDTERDPALEEEFILRMQPGEDCDYLRQAVAERRFGPRSQGGADITIKSLTKDGRRAVVNVRGHLYAASLVDLPCIVEAMKSWDKRGWYKSADVCQMLLVLGRINTEEEAHTYPLPKDVDKSSFQYAHGLTPPLRHVRKRRFRKRISNRTIEAVELEVARLLKEDMAAESPPEYEILDYTQYMRETSAMSEDRYNLAGQEYDDEQDAEGEVDDYAMDGYAQPSQEGGDEFEDELAAEMEAALAAHADGDSAPAADAQMPAATAAGANGEAVVEVEGEENIEAGTPTTVTKPPTLGEPSGDEGLNEGAEEEEEESEEEEEGSSGDEDEADADMDEDALEQQRQLAQQREEIAELEALVQTETAKWERMMNPILKSKLGKRVQSLKQALELKKVSFGEGGDG
ncbi:hypothetical protein AJ79_01904 [Helicocarpus griseus UAMH5409]|uniref:TAFII55 protein conserved region domain-containing protein n=1 Tax=Helicocarpus griseus UAMH5409 TaxID=1447875 RepID=A0A2B7Y670_9EURO|nr:hypothetical protein AJ79_01904 [Helicocarpus griseus UAMH5409]